MYYFWVWFPSHHVMFMKCLLYVTIEYPLSSQQTILCIFAGQILGGLSEKKGFFLTHTNFAFYYSIPSTLSDFTLFKAPIVKMYFL